MPNNSKPNRLIAEKSPYSFQYAHTPIDWHPWGEEAFEAKRENNSVHRLLDLSLVADVRVAG
ncbi:thymidylate kinase [Bacillus atrophaeus]|nr:thymidylate kinase [Bacillus atrophaeus]